MPPAPSGPQQLPGAPREVLRLALPVILSMVSHTVTSAIEVAFLGDIGTVEQGAAGLGNALVWSFFVACSCCGIGVQMCVAQAYGARRLLACGAVAWQGIYVSLCAWGLLIAVEGGAPWLVHLSDPSPELREAATLYVRIALLGSLPMLLNSVLMGFFRGVGDTRTPLVVTLGIQLLNIGLDLVFLFGWAGGPRWGVAGAALASVHAAAGGTVVYVVLFLSRGRRAGFLARLRVPFDRQGCWHLLQVSWPIGVQGALEMSAWTLFTALIAHLGAVEAAAHTIALRVMALCYLAAYGFSIAATTLVGQYLGAQQFLAAQRSTISCVTLTALLMSLLSLAILCGRATLVGWFTHDPAVVPLGTQLLVYVALAEVCDGVGVVAIGALRGVGDTRWPMGAGLVLHWGLFIPGAVLVMFVWEGGILGGWSVALGYLCVLGVTMGYRLRRHKFGNARDDAVRNHA